MWQTSIAALAEAEGIVLLDGAPLGHVEVRFIPKIGYGAEYTAKGVTNKAGQFTMTCRGLPGACVGENYVLIMEPDLPADLRGENAQFELAKYLQGLGNRPLPQKYADLTDSPLVANVTADANTFKFELMR